MRFFTRSSPQNTIASCASRERSRFCAKFRRASGNHFAPGILWPSTSTRSPRVPITPPPTPSPSHTLVQNCSGCATDQACSAS